MIARIKSLMKVLQAIIKVLPVVLEVIEDLSDDGKRNHSNSGSAAKGSAAKATA